MGGEKILKPLKRLFGSSAKTATGPKLIPSTASTSTPVPPACANPETRPPKQVAVPPSTGGKVQDVEVKDLWADALQRLSDEDKTAIQQSSTASKLDMLQGLCAAAEQKRHECDDRRWKFEFNGRQIILRDVTEKIVVWINKFKEIGDIVVNFDPVHAALPWAAVRFLLQIPLAESQQMGAMLIGVEKVTYIINRCKIYEVLYLHDKQSGQAAENLELALVELYAAMLQFLAKANRLYKSFSIRALHGILNNDEVIGFVTKCENLETRVDIEVSNCERTYNRTAHAKLDECGGKLNQLLRDLQEPIMRTDSRVAALYNGLSESEQSDILNWLSGIQYEKNHRTAREGRTEGTGKWLLEHERFRDWRRSSSSMILWLHGIPGAGKTKLTSTVVDDMLNRLRQFPNDEALAYFYCDRNQHDRQNPTMILNSFIRQLSVSKKDGSVQPSIVEFYKQKKCTGFASGTLDIEESREILLQLVQHYPQITLVVDALDECNKKTRKQLVDTLDMLVSKSSNLVKIFISSRPDQDIKHRFEGGPNMGIKATDNRSDIAKFVSDKMDSSPEYWQKEITPVLKMEICETLVDKSEGMFQWVSLQIDQLLDLLPRERDIRERLGTLPETLDKAYDEIYKRIQAQGGSAQEIANRAFQWVMCSCSPLSPVELVAAVCQNPETDGTDSVDVNISYVLSACHNLLVVDQELGVLRLSHLSVQEYFENHHWSRSTANTLVAKVCLVLLNDPDQFEHDLHPADGQGGNDGIGDIILYTRVHWATHVQRHNEEKIDDRLSTLLKRFLGSMDESGLAYRCWHKMITTLFDDHRRWQDFYNTPLHMYEKLNPPALASFAICAFGFHKILSGWWVDGFADSNQRNHIGESLLQLAAARGSASVTEELLRKNADTNSKDIHGWTALHDAALDGHKAVVQLLLEHGADADAEDTDGRTALQVAARSGSEMVVQQLLEHGANANAKDISGRTALQWAAHRGHKAVVQLLLEHKAYVEAKNKEGWTALQCAAQGGHESVVQLLLEHGADVDAKDYGNQTALCWAARKGHKAVVQQLLEHGADVDAKDYDNQTALYWAALKGHKAVAQLLLEHGADADAKDIKRWTVLHQATQRRREARRRRSV